MGGVTSGWNVPYLGRRTEGYYLVLLDGSGSLPRKRGALAPVVHQLVAHDLSRRFVQDRRVDHVLVPPPRDVYGALWMLPRKSSCAPRVVDVNVGEKQIVHSILQSERRDELREFVCNNLRPAINYCVPVAILDQIRGKYLRIPERPQPIHFVR